MSNNQQPVTVPFEPPFLDYKHINLGRRSEQPKPLKAIFNDETAQWALVPLRGRPSRKSPYELAYERRKGYYHSLVRLPSILPALGSEARHKDGQPFRDSVERIAIQLQPITKPVKLTLAVRTQLEKESGYRRQFDDRHVRRTLRSLGFNLRC